MGDNYRRPRRDGESYAVTPTSTSSRKFTSHRSGKPINPSYGVKE